MSRELRQAFGLFLALLAVLAQVTMAAAMPRLLPGQIADTAVICHQDNGASPAPQAPPHHAPDCLLCVFCHHLGAPAALAAAPPVLPAPRIRVIAPAAVPPPSTAPPVPIVLAARPRAPPVPV